MASPEDGAQTQQNTKEEKPDVQSLQIVVKAQVRSVSSWPFLPAVVQSAVIHDCR